MRDGARNLVEELKKISGGSFAKLLSEKYAELEVPVDVDRASKDFNRFDATRKVINFLAQVTLSTVPPHTLKEKLETNFPGSVPETTDK